MSHYIAGVCGTCRGRRCTGYLPKVHATPLTGAPLSPYIWLETVKDLYRGRETHPYTTIIARHMSAHAFNGAPRLDRCALANSRGDIHCGRH